VPSREAVRTAIVNHRNRAMTLASCGVPSREAVRTAIVNHRNRAMTLASCGVPSREAVRTAMRAAIANWRQRW
jgi:hypothetical protein